MSQASKLKYFLERSVLFFTKISVMHDQYTVLQSRCNEGDGAVGWIQVVERESSPPVE